MTTNCIVEPRKSYKDHIYTTNEVGYEGVHHIGDAAGKKDYSAVIKQALEMNGFHAHDIKEDKSITVGFGYNTVMSVADKVIKGVEEGHIKRILFIGGCDGAETERNYYREIAVGSPQNTMILTAGCGKYRFNKLDVSNHKTIADNLYDLFNHCG